MHFNNINGVQHYSKYIYGFQITVNEDSSVQVLAEEAHPIEDIDASAVRQVLQEAQSQLATASGDVAKAEAAIAVEVAEALVLAAGN